MNIFRKIRASLRLREAVRQADENTKKLENVTMLCLPVGKKVNLSLWIERISVS